jgi:hypothetical protein
VSKIFSQIFCNEERAHCVDVDVKGNVILGLTKGIGYGY